MSCHDEGRGDTEAIINLCGRMITLEGHIETIKNNDLVHIQNGINRVEQVVNRMANRGTRPTWAVVILILFLSSLSVSLITVLLTH